VGEEPEVPQGRRPRGSRDLHAVRGPALGWAGSRSSLPGAGRADSPGSNPAGPPARGRRDSGARARIPGAGRELAGRRDRVERPPPGFLRAEGRSPAGHPVQAPMQSRAGGRSPQAAGHQAGAARWTMLDLTRAEPGYGGTTRRGRTRRGRPGAGREARGGCRPAEPHRPGNALHGAVAPPGVPAERPPGTGRRAVSGASGCQSLRHRRPPDVPAGGGRDLRGGQPAGGPGALSPGVHPRAKRRDQAAYPPCQREHSEGVGPTESEEPGCWSEPPPGPTRPSSRAGHSTRRREEARGPAPVLREPVPIVEVDSTYYFRPPSGMRPCGRSARPPTSPSTSRRTRCSPATHPARLLAEDLRESVAPENREKRFLYAPTCLPTSSKRSGAASVTP